MRITFDDLWRYQSGIENEEEYPEPLNPMQYWWVIGADGEVLGKVRARLSEEELILLFGRSEARN